MMDERLFYNRKMRLDERGSRPIQKMRHLLKEALQENASLADCAAG
ncbi:hypothetical protein [Aliamphritea spongicola]|nr:hypothetical protein [Aliamphritea spongicola]